MLCRNALMSPEEMNKSQLPYGLRPYEIGYLILLGFAFYCTGEEFRARMVPFFGVPPWVLFGIAVAGGVVMLVGRCREEWQRMPNRSFFIVLAIAWTALFVFLGNATLGYMHSPSLFAWLCDVYTSPLSDEQYGLLIPFVVLALFWWKRAELVAEPLELWWPGILLVAAGLLLHLAGHTIQETQLSVVGFLTGLYGLTGLAWGKNWLKRSFFPFFLLGFCIPPGSMLDGFTFHLRLLVSWIVEHIAHLGLSPDLIRDGTQLFDAQHTFGYEVVAACSGIRSLVALLALTIIYGFVSFKTPWKRAVLIGMAIPLAVLGNVVRLCCTIMVAELGGQAAGKAVETKLGFVTFMVAIICIYFISRWLEASEPRNGPDEGAGNPKSQPAEGTATP
jgi:exosortase